MIDINILRLVIKDQQKSARKQIPRFVERSLNLADFAKGLDVLVVSGVRRCGKSALLQEFYRHPPADVLPFYLRLDDPRLSAFHESDFEAVSKIWQEEFSNRPGVRVFYLFDEVQMIEGWERWIPFFAEQEGIKVVVTGSNASMLSQELGTLLTGRHQSLELYPFSFAEIAQFEGLDNASLADSGGRAGLRALHTRYFEFGGFPRAWLDEDVVVAGRYFSDIIARDVVARKSLRHTAPLTFLATSLMTDLGSLANKAKLARKTGLKAPETVTRYVRFLEECYLLFEVRKFSFSLREQLRNPGKPYAIDSALAVQAGFTFLDKQGPLFENQVFIELKRRALSVYYWRSTEDYEVDFITMNNQRIHSAVQVCCSLADESTLRREVRALLAAERELGIKELMIITLDEEKTIKEQGCTIRCLPFFKWALCDPAP